MQPHPILTFKNAPFLNVFIYLLLFLLLIYLNMRRNYTLVRHSLASKRTQMAVAVKEG